MGVIFFLFFKFVLNLRFFNIVKHWQIHKATGLKLAIFPLDVVCMVQIYVSWVILSKIVGSKFGTLSSFFANLSIGINGNALPCGKALFLIY